MQSGGHKRDAKQARPQSLAMRQRQHVQRAVAVRSLATRLPTLRRLQLSTVCSGCEANIQQEPPVHEWQ